MFTRLGQYCLATVVMAVLCVVFGTNVTADPSIPAPSPGVSIPGAVFDGLAPIFSAGVGQVYGEQPPVMPKPNFDPSDSLPKQLQDTVDMFVPRDIVPSERPQYANEFDNLVARAAWIVNTYNGGQTTVPPITVTGVFTPGMVYNWDVSLNCGATTWGTNYSCGRIAISQYKEWVTGDNDLLTLVGVLAHEDGHNQRAVQWASLGVSFADHIKVPANAANEEAQADIIAGRTLARAIKAGALPSDAACYLVRYLTNNSYDWDSIHKGPEERRERVILGMSQEGLQLAGC